MDDSVEDLERWDRELVWHPFTQMAEYHPFIVESADGCVLTDIHGREYLDGVSSLWCNIHGHRHPHLDDALRRQLDRVAHVTALGASHPLMIQLARRLVDVTPAGLNHVFFASDGAAAVEVALKLAFQYWRQRPDPRPGKTQYIALENAYHGDTIGGVSVGDVPRFHALFGPLLFDVIRLPAPNPYRPPDNVAAGEVGEYCLGRLRRELEAHHDEVAAVVIEPLVQGAAGMIMHPPGFLKGVRELTARYDVLLVADEIAVGFGRTGTLFACEQEDVSPDLLCLGKGLTAGYLPMAATLATSEIWRAFLGEYSSSRTFFHGHTYSGNPLSAAVGLANLELFESERTLERLPPKSQRLTERLGPLRDHPHVGDVRQRGLIAAVELSADRDSKRPFPWQERRGWRACQRALVEGVYLRPLGDVIVIMPPLAITIPEIDRLCDAVIQGVLAATQ